MASAAGISQGASRLELQGVSVVRGRARILESVSLTEGRSEIVVVIGPNGAGKSTLLEAVIGAAPVVEGRVLIDGRVPTLGERAAALAYLAGEAEPAAEARVGQVLETTPGEEAWCRELAARLSLATLRSARVGTLSRGERRRLLLFEALARARPFLLLDEPTGVFDPLQLVDVVDLFREVARRGAGLLLTVHQMSDAEALGARLVLLNRGRVVASGTLEELAARAQLPSAAGLKDVFVTLLRDRGSDAAT